MVNTLLGRCARAIINPARAICPAAYNGRPRIARRGGKPARSHFQGGPDIMARTMQAFHPELRPGDAFLHTRLTTALRRRRPYAPVPVIDDSGSAASRRSPGAPWPTSGTPSQPPDAATARGRLRGKALIFPSRHRFSGYYRDLRTSSACAGRGFVCPISGAAILALVGGGADRLSASFSSSLSWLRGRWTRSPEHAQEWFDYSEGRTAPRRSAVCPRARSRATSTHDPFPGTPRTASRSR